MTKRTEKVTFRTTPKFKKKLKDAADSKSMNLAEVARIGTIKQVESLEKGEL